jgi:hypothetical protein
MPNKSKKTVDPKRKRKSTVKDLPPRSQRGDADAVKGGRIQPKRPVCGPMS